MNNDLEFKVNDMKNHIDKLISKDVKELKLQVKERVQKFQDKRDILIKCRSIEKSKRNDILKCDQSL